MSELKAKAAEGFRAQRFIYKPKSQLSSTLAQYSP
jgi:hypothetical protein